VGVEKIMPEVDMKRFWNSKEVEGSVNGIHI
jgi:hypothetical protein